MFVPETAAPIRAAVPCRNCYPRGSSVDFFVPRGSLEHPWGLATVPMPSVLRYDGGLGDSATGVYNLIGLDPEKNYRIETRDKNGAVLDAEFLTACEIVGSLVREELKSFDPASAAMMSPSDVFLVFRKSGMEMIPYLDALRTGRIDLWGRPVGVPAVLRSNGCGGIE